jgi:predicted aminopeptidase
LLLVIALSTSGCYYAHVAIGQTRLLRARQPIESILADPATPPEIQRRLRMVQQAREFATELGLDVGEQYTSFVAWPGDRIVTTVVATRPGEIAPAGFYFPLLGRLPYKGFFDRERAAEEAAELRSQGMDVCEFGVRAYSTLGWMNDPVTGPMLRRNEGELMETILHELVHATVYVKDHVDFNESVARFIGEEASVAFYDRADQTELARQRRLEIRDARRIDAEIIRFRDEVEKLYATHDAGPARDQARLGLEERTRDRVLALPLENLDPGRVAGSLRMNDACVALTGTYASDQEHYREALAQLGGDLESFVARLEVAADAEDPLQALLEDRPISP